MGTWVILKDAETSDQLFSGSDIYCYVKDVKFANANIINATPVSLSDTTINSADTTNATTNGTDSLTENLERRKPYVSFGSSNQTVITITGKYIKNLYDKKNGSIIEHQELGNTISKIVSDTNVETSGTFDILTPYKILRMFHSGHKFYFKDSFLFDEFTNNTEDSKSFYKSDGIPVVLKSFNYSYSSNKEDELNFTIILWEDKYSDV